jgi:CrcB protein
VSLAIWIGVGLLGGAGAVLRFLVDGAISARATTSFPVGTLAVNVSGAFALGLLSEAVPAGDALRLLSIGLVGAYTTFSTWMLETQRLAEDGEARMAAANIVVSLAAGLLAAWVGMKLGAQL